MHHRPYSSLAERIDTDTIPAQDPAPTIRMLRRGHDSVSDLCLPFARDSIRDSLCNLRRQPLCVPWISSRAEAVVHRARRTVGVSRRDQYAVTWNPRLGRRQPLGFVAEGSRQHAGVHDDDGDGISRAQHERTRKQRIDHSRRLGFEKPAVLPHRQRRWRDIYGRCSGAQRSAGVRCRALADGNLRQQGEHRGNADDVRHQTTHHSPSRSLAGRRFYPACDWQGDHRGRRQAPLQLSARAKFSTTRSRATMVKG